MVITNGFNFFNKWLLIFKLTTIKIANPIFPISAFVLFLEKLPLKSKDALKFSIRVTKDVFLIFINISN